MRTRLFLLLTVFLSCVSASHFSGGTLSWAPANNDSAVINSTISILINQRYTWLRTTAASSCASNTILAHGVIGDVSSNVLNCFSDPALCSRFNFTGNISTLVPCSDYNTLLDIAQGHSETWTDFNVLLQGLIIGFVSTNDSWQSLALGGGQWSMMMYLNLTPRPYSGLINHSPTSSMPLVNYVALGINHTITLVIPMDDRDGDMIQCRFARSSVSWEGVAVNECAGACAFVALPSNAQLISINNACTLTVTLPSAGNYAVAVQLEDALVNSTHALSSVPLQFLLVAIDTSNSSSNCPYSPRIAGISPDFPSQNSTITVQMSVPYLFTVIAQIGCLNDTGTNITNFLSTSPHGMLRDDLPHRLTSSSYAINHTWTPTRDQFGQTLMFCTVAVDSHFYSSAPYCFQFFVDYQIEGTTDQLTHTDPTWALSTGDDTSELWSTAMSDGETTILSSTTSRTTATTTSVTTTTATTATTTTTTTSVSTSTSTTTTSVTTTTTTTVTGSFLYLSPNGDPSFFLRYFYFSDDQYRIQLHSINTWTWFGSRYPFACFDCDSSLVLLLWLLSRPSQVASLFSCCSSSTVALLLALIVEPSYGSGIKIVSTKKSLELLAQIIEK